MPLVNLPLSCINNMAKIRQWSTIVTDIIAKWQIPGYLPWWIRRMGSILPCCFPCGKAGGLQILRCWGFEVKYYTFTLRRLDSEALRLLQRWGLGWSFYVRTYQIVRHCVKLPMSQDIKTLSESMRLNFNPFFMVSAQDYSALIAVRRVMKILKEIWKGVKKRIR